jgi:hypothetical protein
MKSKSSKSKKGTNDATVQARRKFLTTAGKFAIVTPAAVTGLLAASKGNYAMAVSGGGGGHRNGNNGNHGGGNNGHGGGGGRGR